MFSRKLLLVAALALLDSIILVIAAEPQCFLPNGKVDDNDLPCFSNDAKSRCCAPDELCSTNKLCVLKTGQTRFARGSCLDKSYGPSCPTFCKGINDATKVDLFQCGDPSLGQFCCDEGKGNDCCTTPSKILTLGIVSTFPEGTLELSSAPILSMAQSPRPTSSSRSSTSIPDGRSSTILPSSSAVASTIPAAAAMPTPATSIVLSTSVVVLTSIAPAATEVAISTTSTLPSFPQPIASAISEAVGLFPPSSALFTMSMVTEESISNSVLSVAPTPTGQPSKSLPSIPISTPLEIPTPDSTTETSIGLAEPAAETALAESLQSTLPSESLVVPSKPEISTPAEIGIAIGGAVFIAGFIGLGYYVYLTHAKRRFSRRFERTLTVEKEEKRGSVSSWASKIGLRREKSSASSNGGEGRRALNISVPIKAYAEPSNMGNSGGYGYGETQAGSGYASPRMDYAGSLEGPMQNGYQGGGVGQERYPQAQIPKWL